jgi:multiple antibiotic resistance protein
MEQFSFILTIFFMLLGPVKLIPSFGALTRGADRQFKRAVAIRGAVVASALCAIVALAGGALLDKYRISLDAVRIAGGLILLISALQVIFRKSHSSEPGSGKSSAMQLAVSPVAVPMIVPHAGVAAILLCMAHAPQFPGVAQSVAIALAIMMVLDFLVMYFIDGVAKTPGLPIILNVLGSVLIFVQAALAINMMLVALRSLGLVQT